MITCSNCETPQFVQIVQSRVYFEDGTDINEISESYECTICGGEGGLIISEDGEKEVHGDVVETVERPRASI